MTIEIEKGVPIPSKYPPRKEFPFEKMAVGDSFAVAKEDQGRLATARWAYRQAHPEWGFVARAQGEVVRIWRTA